MASDEKTDKHRHKDVEALHVVGYAQEKVCAKEAHTGEFK